MNKNIVGLFFIICVALMAAGICYCVFFCDGARKWSEGAMAVQKRLWGDKLAEKQFKYILSPTVIKVASIVLLFAGTFGIYAAIMSFDK